MPGFNPDKINIHELTVEEPEKEGIFFDPEKDISKEDRKAINKYRESLLENKDKNSIDWFAYARLSAGLKILGEDVKLSESTLQDIDTARGKWGEGSTKFYSAQFAAWETILGHRPELTESEWEAIESERVTAWNVDWASFAMLSSSCAILGRKFEYLPGDFENIERTRELAKKEGFDLAQIAAAEAVLGHKPKLSKEDWQAIKHDIKNSKGANWLMFTDLAVDATILSADEIRVPEDGGLELIRHKKDLEQDALKMPEQRNF